MTAVFRDLDKVSLDREYDNRGKVADKLGDYFTYYAGRSLFVRANFPCHVNMAYGDSGGQTLDIFPGVGDGPRPVQVFIHGGYWRGLDSKDFSYIAGGFRDAGVSTVVLNYTLIPDITLAGQVDECRAGLAWVWQNIGAYGGDNSNIHLSGHSAGGHLTAMLMATDWTEWDVPADVIKGGTGISGLYDLVPVALANIHPALNFTDSEVAENSPLTRTPTGSAQLYLPFGEKEGPEYARQSEDMAAAWTAHGISAVAEPFAGHDHFSIAQGLGDPQSTLTRRILAQMGLA